MVWPLHARSGLGLLPIEGVAESMEEAADIGSGQAPAGGRSVLIHFCLEYRERVPLTDRSSRAFFRFPWRFRHRLRRFFHQEGACRTEKPGLRQLETRNNPFFLTDSERPFCGSTRRDGEDSCGGF
jgi:hypothetical protein